MYTTRNYKTKKALRADFEAGVTIGTYFPGLGGSGTGHRTASAYLEGPHYPAPHTWYAQGEYDVRTMQLVGLKGSRAKWLPEPDGTYTFQAAPAPRPKAAPTKPASIPLCDGTEGIDHTAYPLWAKSLSDDALRFNLADARAAVEALPEGHKAGYYADEVSYLARELSSRRSAQAALDLGKRAGLLRSGK